ncbi:4'-phosphopantetheinyl transferase superfamily protein [Streptomyces sp. NPDC005209]|uniref:4'-phosphopantetheinyl transferase family protein n=1 Tax=Streptomyces sp. NPDC005209 TaxID=3156715 RepID=UPI0033A70391
MTATDHVEIWPIGLQVSAPALGSLRAKLDDRERARCARLLDPTARARYAVAHGAARLILAGRLNAKPEQIRWRTGPHGKPELTDLARAPHVSLSHSDDLALLAVADREVGVDVERIAVRWAAVPPVRLFLPEETAAVAAADHAARARLFTQLFTRKEACVKAAGGTMLPHGIRLRTLGESPLLVSDSHGAEWRVRDLGSFPGYGAAVALRGPGDFTVGLRRWSAQ